jgi:hypothetical protein
MVSHKGLERDPFQQRGGSMRRPFDTVVIFGTLWLLGSMTIDVLTPKELTVFMIGAALAPGMALAALLYALDYPLIDFSIAASALWVGTTIALTMITPKPLSSHAVWVGLVPPLVAGGLIRVVRKWLGKKAGKPESERD